MIVHGTQAEVSGEDSAIQTVFAALVEDQRRTDQICADIHSAVAAGRTCLVLTQRTDHIDAIVARLGALGDTALVLRGASARRPEPL